MSIETNHRSHETVWTLRRVISVAASLMMISALGIISYHIGDLLPAATATTPPPVNANAPAPGRTRHPRGLTCRPKSRSHR